MVTMITTVTARRLIGVSLLAAACSSPRVVPATPPSGPPIDFSLDVVFAPAEETTSAIAGRYVLFPDGSLHSSGDPGPDADWLPPRTRLLDASQVAALWTLCREGGLADPERGDPLVDPVAVVTDPGRTTCFVALTGSGRRWNVIRRGTGEGVIDEPLRRLLTRLADLGWAADRGESGLVPPRRYHFGADPYEGYR